MLATGRLFMVLIVFFGAIFIADQFLGGKAGTQESILFVKRQIPAVIEEAGDALGVQTPFDQKPTDQKKVSVTPPTQTKPAQTPSSPSPSTPPQIQEPTTQTQSPPSQNQLPQPEPSQETQAPPQNIPIGGSEMPIPDTQAPTISITSPENGAAYTSAQTISIAVSASDNVGVTKVEFYDGSVLRGTDTTAPYSFSWSVAASNNGSHTWTALAYDAAGNVKTSNARTFSVTITPPADIQVPIASIASPNAGTIYTSAQSVIITASASDNVGVTRVEFYDGTTLKGTDTSSPYVFTWNVTTSDNGNHIWTVRAYDAAGNNTTSAQRTLLVNIPVPDTQAPTVSITTPANGTTYTTAQSIIIGASASDNVGVTRVEFYDGTTLKGTDTSSPYSFSWNATNADNGSHTWTARAHDAAGNNTYSSSVTTTINIPTGGGGGTASYTPSKYLETIPNPGPCDVVITPENQATTLTSSVLNDPTKRVFCVNAGDYRAAKHIRLSSSGTPSARRYLRYNAPFPAPAAYNQTARATFHGLWFSNASYWVVEGLTIQPTVQDYVYFVVLWGSSHNIFERNFIDASIQNNTQGQKGFHIETSGGIPSAYNSIQNNVLRGGNKNRLPLDYAGILIGNSPNPNIHDDNNKILDNEIVDWGDAVQVYAQSNCTTEGHARGTIIDGNDMYITQAKYADCTTGALDPNGDCACAENAIDIKTPAGSNPSEWTIITNNRMWGYRPTLTKESGLSCGGSGSNGAALGTGNACADNLFIAKNIVWDSTIGISSVGRSIMLGNLLIDIHPTPTRGSVALFPLTTTDDGPSVVQFNTVINSNNPYKNASNVTTQCNVVINDDPAGSVGSGTNQVSRYNYSYNAQTPAFNDPTTDKDFPNATDSKNESLCVTRMRKTNPTTVCIPLGGTTSLSPHASLPGTACTNDPGAPFGFSGVSFPTTGSGASSLGQKGLLIDRQDQNIDISSQTLSRLIIILVRILLFALALIVAFEVRRRVRISRKQ